jgi:hypothetical protein
VLKQKSGAAPATLATGTASATGSVASHRYTARLNRWSGLRLFFSVARRLDYWSFLLR